MKLPFGLKAGRLVTTTDVASGRACGAVCPSCLGPLVARKGEVLVHHFGHDGFQMGPGGKSPCTKGYQTALGKMAVQIISDYGELALPPLTVQAQRHSHRYGVRRAERMVVEPGTSLLVSHVQYNRPLSPDVKPAVLCTVEGFGQLAIELNLNGNVSNETKAAYAALGISCIEVDFSAIALPQAKRLPTVEDIRRLLYTDDVKRQWVFHRDMPGAESELSDELAKQLRQEEKERRTKRRTRPRVLNLQPRPSIPDPPRPKGRDSANNRPTLWAFCRPCYYNWEVDISSGRTSFVICPKCHQKVTV